VNERRPPDQSGRYRPDGFDRLVVLADGLNSGILIEPGASGQREYSIRLNNIDVFA
jgi:hypothetical protein